jgi:hypothetical protein
VQSLEFKFHQRKKENGEQNIISAWAKLSEDEGSFEKGGHHSNQI